LKLYGHGDAKLLDGGREKWEVDGRGLAKGTPARDKTSYQAQDQSIRAFRDEVVASIGKKNLIEVRSPDEFSGKLSRWRTYRTSRAVGEIPLGLGLPRRLQLDSHRTWIQRVGRSSRRRFAVSGLMPMSAAAELTFNRLVRFSLSPASSAPKSDSHIATIRERDPRSGRWDPGRCP
jgi:hypothetical protein